jgi:hypothetical protein
MGRECCQLQKNSPSSLSLRAGNYVILLYLQAVASEASAPEPSHHFQNLIMSMNFVVVDIPEAEGIVLIMLSLLGSKQRLRRRPKFHGMVWLFVAILGQQFG